MIETLSCQLRYRMKEITLVFIFQNKFESGCSCSVPLCVFVLLAEKESKCFFS